MTEQGESKRPEISRRMAALYLGHPRHIGDSFTLAPQNDWRASLLAGGQAALTLMIALPLIYLSPWSDMIGYAALGSLCALFARFAPHRVRTKILAEVCAVQTSGVLLMSLLGLMGASEELRLVMLTISCGLFYWIALTRHYGPPGPLIFIFAAGAAMHTPADMADVLMRTAATGSVALLAWMLCWISEHLRRAKSDPLPLIEALDRQAIRRAAIRCVVAAGLAIFISYALGAEHAMWAAMAAMAVMQAPRLNHALQRTVQRCAGTVVGTLLIWLFLNMEPNIWAIFGALILLQIATELVIGSNYGLGQIFVTPMALLMTYIASPSPDASGMISERIWDTLLGAGVGLMIALLWSSSVERADMLPRVHK